MPKRVLSCCFNTPYFHFPKLLLRKVYRLVCFVLFFYLPLAGQLFAEGSKDISASGGYRAFLFSSPTGNPSYPFPTLGTMKVYVKAGETINVGSSAQGIDSGTVKLRAPDGSTYTSGHSATIGLIGNRSQELAGPMPNAGGYTPFTIKVQAGQEGIWEIDFISPSNGVDYGNPTPALASAPWTQPQGQYIAAFDVSVRDANNSKFLKGRVFTNVFSGILGTFNVGFNGIFNILTSDGYQYTINNNGQAGNGFTFFANNKGFRNAPGSASYLSIDDDSNPNVQDPRAADSQTDITQKIFFNTPASDMPVAAKTPGGITTWLLSPPVVPSITNTAFTGIEGTSGKSGTNPLGANFTFTASAAGTYLIAIDVNKNGVFTDAIDRNLTGTVNPGTNTIFWDGLDGQGNKVPADPQAIYKANIMVTNKAGEVHFPFFDVERNVNGIILTRINGNYAPDDTVYWNDSPILALGTPPIPIKNLTGISSLVNGHKWGIPTTDSVNQYDFGNNKGIDTWSYISTAPIQRSVTFQLQEADLAIDSISAIAGCAGQPVQYTIRVKNNGPSDVTGAKFQFNFPAEITVVSASSSPTSGASSTSNETTSSSAYNTDMDMASGSVRTFIITGTIAQTASGSLPVSASMIRPPDVTDPDATNPDAAPPTDPADECNALPSGQGCNNIKAINTAYKAAPSAGADQTIVQYDTATLSGTEGGTWVQANNNPSATIIVNPSSASTAVTGFDNLGIYHFILTNENACADTIAVTVIAAGITIPNIFTPNGDGKNDVFKIAGLESFPGSQLIIFNRWGNEVYRADNYLNNWDGSGLADGTYYYLLNRRDRNGGLTAFKGWVFLKRSKQ
ncbi:gliding motility-associated C-terminal domain-containing protein [uncultured Mucilaginibacter sp.]|uniref:T9SS type B sorting domain-containing protein n=1 Tax=uncultured Mucilaginibacter sp. TaxID=797541 RepID=UPI0025D3E9D2|nr:gliding motility-associated C-terminal domain-containing protein [uncultured Mucilaginibacter sp.]